MLSNKKVKFKPKPTLNTFYTLFKHIASEQDQGEFICDDDSEETFIIDKDLESLLDSNFTSEEIDLMITNLKNEKKLCQ